MGIYLNPGNEKFTSIARMENYVDKTGMLRVINSFIDSGNKYICVSRPRRFGKTFAGNMLAAYYSKGCSSEGLFAGFKIAGEPTFAEKLNKYNVIKIDMNSEYQNTIEKGELLRRLTREIVKEMKETFPTVVFEKNDSLAQCILRVYAEKKETFILLIDEYDVLVRETNVPPTLFAEYLSFLNGLFKSDTLWPAISLAYLTGILPVVRDKIQSKLNNFREYTILNAGLLSEYVGFTAEETERLCHLHGMDDEECRRWYDGYHLKEFEIYNPESVVRAVEDGEYGSYWGQTSSYEVISERIRQNFAGTKEAVVRMLAGEEVPVNVTRYLNTMTSFHTKDDLLTYLIHLGYLAYNRQEGTCRIPNREVRQEWFNAIETEEEYAVTNRIIQDSRELLASTLSGDAEAVARALDVSHIHVTSNRSYNNEDALQSAIYLAYIYALNSYTVVREMTTGKGFADVVFIPVNPKNPAMIIEHKRNGCAESALDQIRNKRYFSSLTNYLGNLLFVGINYDEKEKTHTCQMEMFVVDGEWKRFSC